MGTKGMEIRYMDEETKEERNMPDGHEWELMELPHCHVIIMNDTQHEQVGLKPKDGVVLVMVNDLPPFVLEHEVWWSGLVRVHCVSEGTGMIYYYKKRI